jgi:hypothetical protein
MKKLYLDDLPEMEQGFSKEAGFTARLSDTPDNWGQELSSELFKQLPFLSDYSVNVNLDRTDVQRRFAFGYADVSNATERPEDEHSEAGLPHLRIPLIVENGAARPFNTMLDGNRVMPLTEERVRGILFNPATFDLSNSQPTDPSLGDSLAPPTRMGGMSGETGPQVKTAGSRTAQFFEKTAVSQQWINKRMLGAVSKGVAPEKFEAFAKRMTDKTGIKNVARRSKQLSAAREAKSAAGVARDIAQVNTRSAQRAQEVRRSVQGMEETAARNARFEEDMKSWGQRAGSPPPPVGDVNTPPKKEGVGTSKKVLIGVGAGATAAGLGLAYKQREKTASLLLAIAPTIRETDRTRFLEKVASSETLQAGFRRSGILPLLSEVFDKTKTASARDRLLAAAENIPPTVISIQKLPSGDFFVKSASTNAFVGGPEAQGKVVSGAEAAQAIGPQNAAAMQPGQTATLVGEPVDPAMMEEEPPLLAKPVEEFGEYKVQDTMGNQLMGWVFPQVLSWDGNFSPLSLNIFSNGAAYALQDTIHGELVGKGTNLPRDTPLGEGVFYYVDGGKAICTAPLMVRGGLSGPDGGKRYTGMDTMGSPVTVALTPGLAAPQRIGEAEFALPSHWKFMRLNNQTQLATNAGSQPKKPGAPQPKASSKPKEKAPAKELSKKEPTPKKKTASVFNTVEVLYNGSFSFRGGCGLEKIATELRQDLDPMSAEFLLGVLGVDGHTAKKKLAQAQKQGLVKLCGLKTITPLSERYQMAQKTAAQQMQQLSPARRELLETQCDLVKEAAALEDEGTADKILALNFVNPENLNTFVEHLPELEQTSEVLAEMLLSGYLGMREIPEAAVERAMKNMEETVQALKAVQHAEA